MWDREREKTWESLGDNGKDKCSHVERAQENGQRDTATLPGMKTQQLWAESTRHRQSWQGLKTCTIPPRQSNVLVGYAVALRVYLETGVIASSRNYTVGLINYMIFVTFH